MDWAVILLIAAVVVFTIAAVWQRSLTDVGLALFAGSFLLGRL